MPTFLYRVCALILIPCLTVDGLFAQTTNQLLKSKIPSEAYLVQSSPFAEQALSEPSCQNPNPRTLSGIFTARMYRRQSRFPSTKASWEADEISSTFLHSDELRRLIRQDAHTALARLLPIARNGHLGVAQVAIDRIAALGTREAQQTLLNLITDPKVPEEDARRAAFALALGSTQEGINPVLLSKLKKARWRFSWEGRQSVMKNWEKMRTLMMGGPARRFVNEGIPKNGVQNYLNQRILHQVQFAPDLDEAGARAKLLDSLHRLRESHLTPLQARDAIRNLFDPLNDPWTSDKLIEQALEPMPGDLLPGTNFRLGGPNNESDVRSLRHWPEYKTRVRRMWPGFFAYVGFLGRGQDFVDVLLHQRAMVQALDTSYGQLADWLEEALTENGEFRQGRNVHYTTIVNGQRIEVRGAGNNGFQESPLPGVRGASMTYWLKNLDTGFELKGNASEMHPELIRLYGFFQGQTSAKAGSIYRPGATYHLDPRELVQLFTGKASASIDGGNNFQPNPFSPTRPWRRLFGRLFGQFIAFVCLTIALIPIGGMALIVKADSPGPVFFTDARLGYGGSTIPVPKLRTWNESQTHLTTFGQFASPRRLNEWPQLWSIVRGDMVWFGPRAVWASQVPQEYVEKVLNRTPPGLFSRNTVRNIVRDALKLPEQSPEDRLRLDLEEIHRSSLKENVKVLSLVVYFLSVHALPKAMRVRMLRSMGRRLGIPVDEQFSTESFNSPIQPGRPQANRHLFWQKPTPAAHDVDGASDSTQRAA